MKMKRTESDVIRSTCEYLKARKYKFYRQNNTPIFQPNGHGGGRFRKMPKYALKGVPDIFVLLPNTTMALEVKTETGVWGDAQKEFKLLWESPVRWYYIVRSVDDVIRIGL